MMDLLEKMGLFASLKSWIAVESRDPNILPIRFEELTGPRQHECFRTLFSHCDIAMPDNVLEKLLEDHSFSKLAAGRQPGQEDVNSHYRKGVIGDWKNHFTDAHVDKFRKITEDLATLAGYKW